MSTFPPSAGHVDDDLGVISGFDYRALNPDVASLAQGRRTIAVRFTHDNGDGP